MTNKDIHLQMMTDLYCINFNKIQNINWDYNYQLEQFHLILNLARCNLLYTSVELK